MRFVRLEVIRVGIFHMLEVIRVGVVHSPGESSPGESFPGRKTPTPIGPGWEFSRLELSVH